MIFSFRNGITFLKPGFEYSYPEAKDANVMQNDQRLADCNVFVLLQTPSMSYISAQFITMKAFRKSG